MAGGVVKGVVRAQQAGHLGWGIHWHLPRLAVPGVQSFLLPSAHPALIHDHVILTVDLHQQDRTSGVVCFTATLLHVAGSQSKKLAEDAICDSHHVLDSISNPDQLLRPSIQMLTGRSFRTKQILPVQTFACSFGHT